MKRKTRQRPGCSINHFTSKRTECEYTRSWKHCWELRFVVIAGDIIATNPVQLVARDSYVRTINAHTRHSSTAYTYRTFVVCVGAGCASDNVQCTLSSSKLLQKWTRAMTLCSYLNQSKRKIRHDCWLIDWHISLILSTRYEPFCILFRVVWHRWH